MALRVVTSAKQPCLTIETGNGPTGLAKEGETSKMAIIGGPKKPGTEALAKVLQLRQPEKVEKVEKAEKSEKTVEKTVEKTPEKVEVDAAHFDNSTTGTQQTLAAPVDGAGQSQVMARLKARGFEGKKVTKTAATSGPSVVQTAEGKVFSGSVAIESRQGLQKLVDVVRVGGDLTIHEGLFKNADLLALKGLKTVERRLTFEGLRST